MFFYLSYFFLKISRVFILFCLFPACLSYESRLIIARLSTLRRHHGVHESTLVAQWKTGPEQLGERLARNATSPYRFWKLYGVIRGLAPLKAGHCGHRSPSARLPQLRRG